MATDLACRVMCLTLISLLIVLWLITHAGRSYACSCLPIGSPLEELAASYAVFEGRVISLQYYESGESTLSDGENTWSGSDPITVRFEVETVWKGPVSQTIYVRTASAGETCGFGFSEGSRYIVYASSGLYVSLCSRTALWGASDELAALGEGQVPEPGTISPASYAASEQVPTKDWKDPTPNAPEGEASGGCGISQHSADIPLIGLMVGVAMVRLARAKL